MEEGRGRGLPAVPFHLHKIKKCQLNSSNRKPISGCLEQKGRIQKGPGRDLEKLPEQWIHGRANAFVGIHTAQNGSGHTLNR